MSWNPFKKSSAPPAPDYAALAKQQSVSDLNANQQTAALARPTQIDSNGSQTWSLKPGADPKNPQAGDWIVNNQLNSTQQGLKDQQDELSKQYGDLASQSMNGLNSTLGTAFNTDGMPQMRGLDMTGQQDYQGIEQLGRVGAGQQAQTVGNAFQGQNFTSGQVGQMAPEVDKNRAELTRGGLQDFGHVDPTSEASRQRITDAMYSRQTAMLDPQTQQQSSDMRSRLATQGITEGSEAYNRAMDNQARQQNEAYQGARDSSILAGGAEDTRIGNQNLGVANFQNQSRGQMFGESKDIVGNQNSNIDQIFSQGLQAAEHNTNVQQMNRNNSFGDAGFNNSNGNQNFQNQMAGAGFNNSANAQNFQQDLQQQGFNNDATTSQAGFNNNMRGQQLSELIQGGNFNNNIHTNAVQEALMKRNLGLNEANALRTGAQVGDMKFQGFGGGGQVQGENIYGAGKDSYGAQMDGVNVANANASGAFKGLTGLGASYLGRPSDRRMKTNIKQIGWHPLGIPWYSWVYTVGEHLGQKWQGVMADELKEVCPEAVVRQPSGYDYVNYALIGGKDGF